MAKWTTADEIKTAKQLRETDEGLYAGWASAQAKRKRWGDIDREEIFSFIADFPPLESFTPDVFERQMARQRAARGADETRRSEEYETR